MSLARVRKGDTVVVISGKDKGKTGKITKLLLSDDKVVVEGVNVAQRHKKPTRAMEQGGIIQIEMPIHVSNVAILDPDGKPTRIGFRVEADGTKTRISRRTGAELS